MFLVLKDEGNWFMFPAFRALNKLTIKYYLLDELFGANIFTKLGIHYKYPQIQLKEDGILNANFHTHVGHYEILVMPFSLHNAPSNFESLMKKKNHPF
jgi:hypothetical protein